jgi:hypothetical protein
VAPPADRPEVDICDAPESSRCARRDPAVGGADGGRESHVGLNADPRGAEKRGASRGPLDDRADSQGARPTSRARAADVVAHISARALGRDRRRGFLHDRSVDVARARPRCGTLLPQGQHFGLQGHSRSNRASRRLTSKDRRNGPMVGKRIHRRPSHQQLEHEPSF